LHFLKSVYFEIVQILNSFRLKKSKFEKKIPKDIWVLKKRSDFEKERKIIKETLEKNGETVSRDTFGWATAHQTAAGIGCAVGCTRRGGAYESPTLRALPSQPSLFERLDPSKFNGPRWIRTRNSHVIGADPRVARTHSLDGSPFFSFLKFIF
jgi:hypothetical protein